MSKDAPRPITWDDFLGELIAIHEDVAECRTPLGQARLRRLEVLERLTVLMQIGQRDVVAALRSAQRALDGDKQNKKDNAA